MEITDIYELLAHAKRISSRVPAIASRDSATSYVVPNMMERVPEDDQNFVMTRLGIQHFCYDKGTKRAV